MHHETRCWNRDFVSVVDLANNDQISRSIMSMAASDVTGDVRGRVFRVLSRTSYCYQYLYVRGSIAPHVPFF